jgi:hypothetical protein
MFSIKVKYRAAFLNGYSSLGCNLLIPWNRSLYKWLDGLSLHSFCILST